MEREIEEKLAGLVRPGLKVGLVGVGRLGSKIRDYMLAHGAKVLLCDPPRNFDEASELGESFFELWGNGMGGCEITHDGLETFVPLDSLSQCDLITVHVPLTTDGKFPTKGLITKEFIASCKPNTVIFNFSSPEVFETAINPMDIIIHFYPDDTPFRRMLIKHSTQVRDKALEILDKSPIKDKLDREIVMNGAMLHDIGIGRCDAPPILCTGSEPYIAHGIIGAQMLRDFAADSSLEPYARICERHTGSGLTAFEIQQEKLPLPIRDFLPETSEEKLICLADKFFSKSGDMQEKPLDKIRKSMAKFGQPALDRFDELCRAFGIYI
ncbi:MAG: HD domain-containing protein [Victivallales bacterium]|nr:HD domain-containing protein [Victivallales bacterium]